MVFGFIKKERRVPDLSRYDYYYQQNDLDYNKSHRLSTAAASAAAAITSGNNSPVLNTYTVNSRRSQSMIYNSNPYTHLPHTNINNHSTSKDPGRRPNNNNNNIQSKQKIKDRHENNRGNSNINYRKTYSLRSQSSFDKNIDLSSIKQRNNNNNNIRSNSSGNTTIPSAAKQRRLNSLSSANGRNSRLNSLTSNGQVRRLKRQQQHQQINNPNNILDQLPRTNSITTTVTRVTDPLGRTTSITKKTIKRIDGYEYIETTTTTTNLVPLNETVDDGDDNNNNNRLLNPSIQKHFDEFSDNFNMTEDEDYDLTILNDINNNTMDTNDNDNNNNLSLTNEVDSYNDELLQDEFNYNNIDDTLNNGTLQELDDDLSLPKEIIEETDYDINMENNNNNNTSENDSMGIDGTSGYEYDNLLLDDIVEEDEKISQDDEIEELGKEFGKDLHDEKRDNNTIYNNHDGDYQDENEEYTIDDKFNQMEIQPKHFAHPYASGLVPLDETSSISKFSDAMESMPSSKENLVSRKSNTPKRSSISTTTYKSNSNNNRTFTASKRPVKKKVIINRQPSGKDETPLNMKNIGKKNDKSTQSPLPSSLYSPPQQIPKKHLTEQEMYMKALEVAKKKVYNNTYGAGASGQSNMLRGDTRSKMGSRMTLRDQSIPKESIVPYHNTSHSTNKHYSKLFGSSLFSKNKHEKNKPIAVSSFPPVTSMAKTVTNSSIGQTSINTLPYSQSREHSASRTSSTQNNSRNGQQQVLSDEDMYAKALELAQKRFNEAQKKLIQRQRQERMNAVKESKKIAKSNPIKSINQNNTMPSVSLDKIQKQSESGLNDETNFQKMGNSETTSTVVSDQRTKNEPTTGAICNQVNEPKVEQLFNNQEDVEMIDTSEESPSIEKSSKVDLQQKPGSEVQYGVLLTAHPEEPFNPNNVIPMPKLEPALSNSKHKHKFPHRPKIDVEKNKSKIRNVFDKVVQFSNENSGYQPPKKEKLKMEEQYKLVEQVKVAKAENIHEQQLHPPPLKVEPYASHGAATTLPVQQNLDHFPNGIIPATGEIFSQRQGNRPTQVTSNDNVTNSSSVFSNSKGQFVDSATPTEDVLLQQEQSIKNNTNIPMAAASITNISTDSKLKIVKITSHSSSKKSKSKFFKGLFKRSK